MLWLCSRFNFNFKFEFEFSGKFLEKFEKFLSYQSYSQLIDICFWEIHHNLVYTVIIG
jgi:hypothetical protein